MSGRRSAESEWRVCQLSRDRVVHRMGLVRLPKLTFQDDAIQEAYDSRLVAGVVDEVVVPTR